MKSFIVSFRPPRHFFLHLFGIFNVIVIVRQIKKYRVIVVCSQRSRKRSWGPPPPKEVLDISKRH